MRTKRITAMLATTMIVSALTVGVLAAPGGAQTAAEFTVVKIVDGEATPEPGTEFTVSAVCTGDNPATFDVSFDAEGVPLAADSFDTGSFTGSCTFTETETGGATSVTYACETSDAVTCTGGGAEPVVFTWDGSDATGTVTVTNTFDPPPPPEPVVVEPVFTG